jgi:hypothetical protein
MTDTASKKWLLLIHQIPPKPNALRVKIWRRLLQVGAVAIKPSVYVMPLTEQSREDLSWTLREVIDGGGDGSISEVRFVEGLTDDQIITLFQNARRSDYEKIIHEANLMLGNRSGKESAAPPPAKGPIRFYRLQRQLDVVAAIDFFRTPERTTAEIVLKKLKDRLSDPSSAGTSSMESLGNLTGKTWVTRENLFVDRIACGWLIRRFMDPSAAFKYVAGPRHSPGPDEIRFDMFDGEYTHEGDRCTFEVMIQRFQLVDRTLAPMAEVVHDIDLKDDKYGRGETTGFNALLTGMVSSQPEDERRMAEGFKLFDALYAWCRRDVSRSEK